MNKRSIIIGVTALLLSATPAMAMTDLSVKVLNHNEVLSESNLSSESVAVKFAQSKISPAQAKSIALSRVKGGQYVDLRRSGNVYIVRVRAPGGRVIDIKVDATTGRVR